MPTPASDEASSSGAAGLAVLLAVAHSYLGERYLLIRLFRIAALTWFAYP